MTDEAKKIVDALRCDGSGTPCETCVYADIGEYIPECKWWDIQADAADLIERMDAEIQQLKEKPLQKPLTLEEACGSEEPCVYLEIHPNQHLKPSIQAVDVCLAANPEAAFDCEIHQIGRNNPALLISTMYGNVWRCWATKPTYEERKAAKWDD